MTFYLVAFAAWACPGGPFSWLIPAKPLLCEPAPAKVERFDRLDKARARVRALGPGASLTACDADRCRDLPVVWPRLPVFLGK